MTARSDYTIIYPGPQFCVIRDDGGGDAMSVTNNAEAVVLLLQNSGRLDGHLKLYYYDSDGQLDELLHDNRGTFLGFRFLSPQSRTNIEGVLARKGQKPHEHVLL
jgi:hypothetical protein